MGNGNDEAKRLVLARRARFVAAAMAGVAGIGMATTACPEPCLSVAPPAATDAGGGGGGGGRDAGNASDGRDAK